MGTSVRTANSRHRYAVDYRLRGPSLDRTREALSLEILNDGHILHAYFDEAAAYIIHVLNVRVPHVANDQGAGSNRFFVCSEPSMRRRKHGACVDDDHIKRLCELGQSFTCFFS